MKSRLGHSSPNQKAINCGAYLRRIGLNRTKPSVKYLRDLHLAHLRSVPYENLDLHYRRRVVLRIGDLFQKVVTRRRGGMAYELNILFHQLLINLSFQAHLVSVRHMREGFLSPEFDHVAILVRNLEGANYLCDVGFGDSFMFPKLMTANLSQLDYTRYYRFERDADENWILQTSQDNSHFEFHYQLSGQERALIEFIPRCDYCQESPDSVLKQEKFITQLFHDGRITLTSTKLVIEFKGEVQRRPILNEDAFLAQLEQLFGIKSRDLLHQLID